MSPPGGTSSRPAGHRSAAGDLARLRGIPMIGGASGAIPGTVSHRQRRLGYWSDRRSRDAVEAGMQDAMDLLKEVARGLR